MNNNLLHPDFKSNPPTILVVEDEKNLRFVFSQVLVKEGYQLQEATSGEECLEICSQNLPDLILLDAILGGIDGFTCCEILHNRFGEECPPILMVTVLDDEDSINLAFEKGANEYITKPINWAVLRRRIERLLKTRWAFQELERRYEQAHQLSLELEKANQQLKQLATVDGLTQIANRRMFDERLKEEWYRARREQLPLTLILSDIDYFKQYNDYYGHQAGDHCLKQVAMILSQNCQRSADFVARYGGEEFTLILAGSSLQDGEQLAEKIRHNILEANIPHQQNPNGKIITLSLGVASLIPDENNRETDLIAQADRALYEAKNQGRNRVVISDQ